MKAFHSNLSALILPLCFAGIATADELTLTPYLDAAVSEANPATNYAAGDLAVGKTAGLAWESFLQFDVGSLPANAVLTAAELRLTSPVGFGSGGSLQIFAPAAGWSETTVTWTNRPEVTTLADAALVVDGATSAHLPLPAPVLVQLQEIVRRVSANRGLKLAFPTATADQLLTLRSRENTSRPQLVINYTLDPELPDFTTGPRADEGRLRAGIFKAPAGAPAPLELVWNTTPGVRYSVWESPDVGSWSRVSGYPAVADALSGLHEIQTTPPKRFFKVQILDEQPPAIVSRVPDDGAFGIKRFYTGEEIGVRLSDATGVDPASISLTLGGIGTFTAASPQLTYTAGLLTLDLGADTPMGAYGALINASLTVADTLGNSATYAWSFELEKQVVLVNGLFTFGSPSAQRAGQRVPPIPTRILAERVGGGGPIRMNDSEWTLESVSADSLVIAYTGTSAPVFSIDQYLTNMTPATLDEIFYRKVTSIQDNAVTKKLTLGTVDVPAWEIVTEASVSLSEDDIAFQADADGRIIRAYQMKSLSGDKKFSLDPLQIDWSGKEIMGLYENANGSTMAVFGLPIADRPPQYDSEWDCKLTLKQATLRLRPSFSISVETSYLSLKKLHSECTVEVDTVLEPEFQFIVPSINYDYDLDNAVNKEPLFKTNFTILIGTGLWVNISPRLRAEASLTAGLTGTVSLGASGGYSQTMVIDYDKDNDPRLDIQARDGDAYFDLITPQVALGGTAGAEFKLKPEIDVKVNSLAGFYVNFDPALGADVNADFNSGNLASADVGLTFNGHVNVGMSVLGVSNSLLPSFEPWEVFDKEWRWYFPESLVGVPLQILVQPAASQTIPPGDNLQLNVQANHETGVTYEWRHNGRRLFVDSPTLKLYGVTTAAAGNYQVTLRYGADEVVSSIASVTVASPPPPITGEFALIPAGSFQMGQDGIATPVHSVYVSAFYMGRYEVTKELWDTVRAWGMASGRGYTDLAAGNGGYASKGANHPVHWITWYDMVKWCNARSQKENLVPCYTVGGSTYKTGSSAPDCNWNASGYRLPTEAEWEKAARGTLNGKNFPWGDTISHSQANYRVYSNNGTTNYYSYDVTPRPPGTVYDYYHPAYNDGVYPYSSPVGSFAPEPNYGLYDMAGNMWERCWDWYGSYPSTSQTDPRGPASGSDRVLRGGSWSYGAGDCRVAIRDSGSPTDSYDGIGFRMARSSVP